jgi:hypothetical protein
VVSRNLQAAVNELKGGNIGLNHAIFAKDTLKANLEYYIKLRSDSKNSNVRKLKTGHRADLTLGID